jgi:hypothetical protein
MKTTEQNQKKQANDRADQDNIISISVFATVAEMISDAARMTQE